MFDVFGMRHQLKVVRVVVRTVAVDMINDLGWVQRAFECRVDDTMNAQVSAKPV